MLQNLLKWLGLLSDEVEKKEKRKEEKEMNNKNLNVSGKTASGDILLGYGLHEVKIVIDNRPCTVFLSIEDPADGVGVCHGSVNKIGVKVLDDGFVLYADITTNTALVKWTCEF